MDLDELLELVHAGDRGAFAAMVSELRGPLRRYYCRGHGVSESDANDFAQEVFLIIHQRLPALESRDSYASFVWWIAKTRMINGHRANKRDAKLLEAYGYLARMPRTSTLSKLERLQREDWLERAIPQMPTPMRNVIRMDMAGGDPWKLAMDEGIEPGTVRTRRYRGWEWLREYHSQQD